MGEGVAGAQVDAVRLYVGGLPEDITSADVVARFTPFGSVDELQLAPQKYAGMYSRPGCRGFGYVKFRPKDDKSLSRCLSLYNGCAWRGRKLRVELAQPDFRSRLQAEWAAEQEEDEEAAAKREEQGGGEEQEGEAAAPQPGSAADCVLCIAGDGSKVVRVALNPAHTPLTHRKYFPPMKTNLSVGSLSWEAPDHAYTTREKIMIGAHVPAAAAPASGRSGNPEEARASTAAEHSLRSADREASAPPTSEPPKGTEMSREAPQPLRVPGNRQPAVGSKHTREESHARVISRTAYVSLHGGGEAPGGGGAAPASAPPKAPHSKRQKAAYKAQAPPPRAPVYDSDSASEDYSELRRLAAQRGGAQDNLDEFEVVQAAASDDEGGPGGEGGFGVMATPASGGTGDGL
mmetsp:Transcript_20867/g.52664  ORF Transcript_20867/g.52664 Transcript_20867/m.52664 type:complete len:404 (-) Transcript_20867:84-1295(-)